ncbi:hypothetical protein C7974DRAFT_138892 [Boeremia exigua]|uniref:uncharacterized protein n=1 Tax=Boeremia exigua TaxID=749465 RepID=UPI001E8D3394|nr:uncharacterized protein C7974DRAFT_138892 [Boeremia exigua]KAH6639789.1 hypothetical protein C7974DRAFT_138892 [Boeremia exigua]
MDMNMDEIVFPNAEFIDGQQRSITQQDDGWWYNTITDQQPAFWPVPTVEYLPPSHRRHHSTSTQSSFSSNPQIATNVGIYPQWQTRSSMASTNSTWSNISEQSYSGASLGALMPIQSPFAASSTESPTSPTPSVPRKKTVKRQVTPERDVFATCVSRRRRNRRTQREPRYWCTSCEEPFVEKYDWKRHEETFQERRFTFWCNLCSALYFLDKDFVHHHETRHNCETCQLHGHLESAKQERQTRTGWGCGFCTHFSTGWQERCNHIAQHFEKDGKTMMDWRQSNVIYSLLQRPAIQSEWRKILHLQPQLRGEFGWNQHNTGRVEGYPENRAEPHLQDLLEYYRWGDNAAALAQLAFQKIAFPSSPPQAPRKDYKDHHNATLQSLMDDQVSWDRFMSTIPEDDVSPIRVCNVDLGNAFDGDAKIYY